MDGGGNAKREEDRRLRRWHDMSALQFSASVPTNVQNVSSHFSHAAPER